MNRDGGKSHQEQTVTFGAHFPQEHGEHLDPFASKVLRNRVNGGALKREVLGIDAALIDDTLAWQGFAWSTANL